MGIVLAVGDPLAGLIAGIAFGIGRAIPIVVLAPLADRPSGERACEAMTMNTGLATAAPGSATPSPCSPSPRS